ncbi:MAG: Asd/ArgC dimerization domain-containing protein [Candidatus Limnocylindrales bacterium]
MDVFLDNGYTKEEWKVVTESRKILHLPDLRLSCTAVRVPVFVAHSEAVHIETARPDHPGTSPDAVCRGPGRRRAGRSDHLDLPARDDRGRVG